MADSRVQKGAPGLAGMTVVEMKDILRSKGLKVSGTRSELMQRINTLTVEVSNIIHPFPLDFGLQPNGSYDPEFINFTNSQDRDITILALRKMGANTNLTTELLKLLNILNDVCIDNIWLLSYNPDQLTQLTQKYPYLEPLNNRPSEPGLEFHFSVEIDHDVSPSSKLLSQNRGTLDRIASKNRVAIEMLQKCNMNDIMRIHLTLVISRDKYSYRVGFSSDDWIAHSSQVIVNNITKEAFVLNSSASQVSYILEMIMDESVELFLQHYIDPEIKVIRMDTCPRTSLQGVSGLCSAWSTVLFLLYILNPYLTRDELYNIFQEYSQAERDRYILQFIYYLYRLDIIHLPGMPLINPITLPNIPKL